MIASEHSNVNGVMFLLNLSIFDVNYEVNGVTAASLATSPEILLMLLQNDSKYPRNFNRITQTQELQHFTLKISELHLSIQNGDRKCAKEILYNFRLRYFFNNFNKSASYAAIECKQFKIYEFLLMNDSTIAPHENIDEIQLDEESKNFLKILHDKYKNPLYEKCVLDLEKKVKCINVSEIDRGKFQLEFRNALNILYNIKVFQPVLQITAASDVEISMDFERNSVNFMDPSEVKTTRGYFGNCAILIGAKDLFDDDLKNLFLATFIHELTHFVMNFLYGNQCRPYHAMDQKRANDFKIIHEICKKGDEKLIEAVYGYHESLQHSELIARPNHLIAFYYDNEKMMKECEENYEELFRFYKERIYVDMVSALEWIEGDKVRGGRDEKIVRNKKRKYAEIYREIYGESCEEIYKEFCGEKPAENSGENSAKICEGNSRENFPKVCGENSTKICKENSTKVFRENSTKICRENSTETQADVFGEFSAKNSRKIPQDNSGSSLEISNEKTSKGDHRNNLTKYKHTDQNNFYPLDSSEYPKTLQNFSENSPKDLQLDLLPESGSYSKIGCNLSNNLKYFETLGHINSGLGSLEDLEGSKNLNEAPNYEQDFSHSSQLSSTPLLALQNPQKIYQNPHNGYQSPEDTKLIHQFEIEIEKEKYPKKPAKISKMSKYGFFLLATLVLGLVTYFVVNLFSYQSTSSLNIDEILPENLSSNLPQTARQTSCHNFTHPWLEFIKNQNFDNFENFSQNPELWSIESDCNILRYSLELNSDEKDLIEEILDETEKAFNDCKGKFKRLLINVERNVFDHDKIVTLIKDKLSELFTVEEHKNYLDGNFEKIGENC